MPLLPTLVATSKRQASRASLAINDSTVEWQKPEFKDVNGSQTSLTLKETAPLNLLQQKLRGNRRRTVDGVDMGDEQVTKLREDLEAVRDQLRVREQDLEESKVQSARVESDIMALKAAMEVLRNDLKESKDYGSHVEEENEALRKEVDVLREDLETSQNDGTRMEREVEALRKETDVLRCDLKKSQDRLQKQQDDAICRIL